jgi:uncharacterized protein YqfA (UPF0365 family)
MPPPLLTPASHLCLSAHLWSPQNERDKRQVAEAKANELESMVKQDEQEMTADKARLWSSEAEVDRLRKASNATPLTGLRSS